MVAPAGESCQQVPGGGFFCASKGCERMITVRMNLLNGKHKGHWEITYPGGRREYADPAEVTLIMRQCRLVNDTAIANRIHSRKQSKTRCSWVEASEVQVWGSTYSTRYTTRFEHTLLSYDPHVQPHWVRTAVSLHARHISTADGQVFPLLRTDGTKIFFSPSESTDFYRAGK